MLSAVSQAILMQYIMSAFLPHHLHTIALNHCIRLSEESSAFPFRFVMYLTIVEIS